LSLALLTGIAMFSVVSVRVIFGMSNADATIKTPMAVTIIIGVIFFNFNKLLNS